MLRQWREFEASQKCVNNRKKKKRKALQSLK